MATVSHPAPVRLPAAGRGRAPARTAWRRPPGLGAVAGATAVATVLAAVGYLVLAAAQSPSVLSPPSARGGPAAAWTLGPLHGVLSGVSAAPHILHRRLLVVLAVVTVAWVVAWIAAPRLPLRVLVAAVLAVHIVLFLGPPLPLTDVFNYGLYGRMAALHGLNPYGAVPALVPHDPLFALSNWHHLRSPYGPLFTLGTEGLTVFGVHGWFWVWKVIVALSSLGSIALVVALAGRLGACRRRAIAAVALSPVLLIGEVGGLHQDMPAMVCLLGAAWCMVRSREADAPSWCDPAAGALVIAAAGIKPSFGIVAGIVVFGARHRRQAIIGAAVAGALTGLVVLVAYGGALPDVTSQALLVNPLSVPNLLGLAAGHGGADHAVRMVAQGAILLVALAATAVVAWRPQAALSALGVVLFFAVLALSWVMPWYIVWALPFVAVGRPRWLAPVAVVAACWLTVGTLPTLPDVLHWAGYYPTRLATGHANHEQTKRLLQ